MKRIICLLFALLLPAACVPTPEQEVVTNKGNQNSMIALAMEEVTVDGASVDPITEAARMDYGALFGIPDHLTLELPAKDGVHSVSIDADIAVPDAALPVVRVFSGTFEQPVVTAFWNALIGDRVMYRDPSMIGRRREPTKDEIADDIRELTALLDQPEHWSDRLFASREEIETEIERLKQAYRKAPESAPPCEQVYGMLETETLTLEGTSQSAHRIGLHAYSDADGSYTSFWVENDSDNREPIILKDRDGWSAIGVDKKPMLSYHRKSATVAWMDRNNAERLSLARTDPIPDFLKDSLTVTPDEAASMLEAIFRDAGIDDVFRVADITVFYGPHHNDESHILAGYEITATRLINGAPLNPLGGVRMMSEDKWSRSYEPYWEYESICAQVDNDGIFDFRWDGLLAPSDTLTPVSSLLPFARIQEKLETLLPMMPPACSPSGNVLTEAHATVTDIRLGLWLVREQNELGKGLLIPCYCLYGDYREQGENWPEPIRYEGKLLYVVNAVDGSIIDPNKGY